jgi:hypothetical protein
VVRLLLVPIGVGVGIGIGIDSDSDPDPDTDTDTDYDPHRDRDVPNAIGASLSCVENMSKHHGWAPPTIGTFDFKRPFDVSNSVAVAAI